MLMRRFASKSTLSYQHISTLNSRLQFPDYGVAEIFNNDSISKLAN